MIIGNKIPIVGISALLMSCQINRVPPVFEARPECPRNPPFVVIAGSRGAGNSPTNLNVNPDQVQVREGCPFEIRFTNNAGNRTVPNGSLVATYTSEREGFWLLNPGQNQSPIRIIPPAGTARDEPYKYTIFVSGLGIIDPRARVIER